MSKLHNAHRIKIRTKVWLEKEGRPVLGAGKLNLLRAVEKEGSISKAAKRVGMSFRRAWGSLDSAEKNIGVKLLERKKGGAGGGSSTLTQQARDLIAKFDQLMGELKEFTERRFRSIFEEGDDNDIGG